MSIPLRDIAGLLYKYWKPFNKGGSMRPYIKCPDCTVPQEECNHSRPPYPNCFRGEDIMEIENYDFGQIFRLQYSHARENDYYILAVTREDMFCLINLQWGTRMSDPMMFPKTRGGVAWSLIGQHASYFIDKMDAELIPVTNVKMTFYDLPRPAVAFSGEGKIGVQR